MAIGSTLRPELGRMDFSGIERGGRAAAEAIMRGSERLGAGIRSAGASIGQAMEKTGEMKSTINSTYSLIKGMSGNKNMNPEFLARLDAMGSDLKNEDIPLTQRYKMAERLSSIHDVLFAEGMKNYMESQKPQPLTDPEEFGTALTSINFAGFAANEEGKPTYNRADAIADYGQRGGKNMAQFEAAERYLQQMGDLPVRDVEPVVKEIPGSNSKLVLQPSGAWSVVSGKEDEATKTEQDVIETYQSRIVDLDRAKEVGILSEDEYNSSVRNLKSETFGTSYKDPNDDVLLNFLQGQTNPNQDSLGLGL